MSSLVILYWMGVPAHVAKASQLSARSSTRAASLKVSPWRDSQGPQNRWVRSSCSKAQIDDQLLPRRAYDELLTRHGFAHLGSAELTPMHALTWGRRA